MTLHFWFICSPMILICYALVLAALAVSIFISFNLSDDTGLAFMNPNVLYNTGRVNRFGAYFLAIIFSIMFLPAAICYWIYKLCTVGRR